MKQKFTNELNAVVKKATDFIENSVKEGELIPLLTADEREENENALYELPNVTVVDRYSNYDEYGVIAVQKKDGKIILHIEGKGEVSDVTKQVELNGDTDYQMADSDVCFLADELAKLIK